MALKEKIHNILRRIEKYTGTDMVYLTKGSFWLTLNQAVAFIAGFISLIIFSNLLPKETYGTYRYILSFVPIFSVFSLPGITGAISQAIARNLDGSFFDGLRAKLKWGVLGALSSFILALYYYFNGNNVLAVCFFITSVFLPLMNAFYLYYAVLVGKKMFKKLSHYEILTRIIGLISIAGAVFFTKNVIIIIFTYFLSCVLIRLILLIITLKKISLNKEKDKQTIPYGKQLSLMGAGATFASQLDKIFIFHFLGSVELAVYALAMAPIEQIRGFLSNLEPLAFPKLSIQKLENIKVHLIKKIKKFEFFLALIILFYITIAPFVFKIAFPQYMESVIYSQVLALMVIFYPKSLLSTAFVAQMRTKELYTIRFLGPVMRIIIIFICVVFFHLWGVVIGTIISEGFLYLLYYRLFRRMQT